jgi:adenylate kinase
MLVVFIGPPGAGKGTQARRLAADLGVPHLSTGDILRRAIERDTPLGRQAASFMNRGQLVPDEVVIDIVGQRIAEPDCASGFLLDGFPRTLEQARALDELLQGREEAIDVVLELQADQEELVRRMLNRAQEEGRADDTPEAIRQRFEVYRRQTEPLLDFYRQRQVLRTVDGTGTPDKVFARIQASVASK